MVVLIMGKIIFKRKLIYNNGSLQVTVPKEIVDVLDLKKGDTIGISLNDESFTCKKVEK